MGWDMRGELEHGSNCVRQTDRLTDSVTYLIPTVIPSVIPSGWRAAKVAFEAAAAAQKAGVMPALSFGFGLAPCLHSSFTRATADLG